MAGLGLLLYAGLLRPLGVLESSRVVVGKEGNEGGLEDAAALDLGEGLVNLSQELLGNGVGQNDLARLGDFGRHG